MKIMTTTEAKAECKLGEREGIVCEACYLVIRGCAEKVAVIKDPQGNYHFAHPDSPGCDCATTVQQNHQKNAA